MILRIRPQTLVAVMAVALLACGGNYSNEDLEFQTALPARGALEAHPPSNLIVADSAEYYRLTRDVVVQLNGLVATVVAWVDLVRGTPASFRSPGQRIWGPFPVREHPGWAMQVTMTKLADAEAPLGIRLDYSFALRKADAPAGDPWITFLFGSHRPGGTELASGAFHITTGAARAAGYPIDDPNDPNDLNDLLVLDSVFDRRGAAFHNVVDVQTVAGSASPAAHYEYGVEADRSGTLRFTFDRDALTIQQLTVISRWRADGAGRADAKVTAGLFAASDRLGVDCWGVDTRASYVRRDWEPAQNRGDVTTCAFGDASF